jgi:hypothetical protein
MNGSLYIQQSRDMMFISDANYKGLVYAVSYTRLEDETNEIMIIHKDNSKAKEFYEEVAEQCLMLQDMDDFRNVTFLFGKYDIDKLNSAVIKAEEEAKNE